MRTRRRNHNSLKITVFALVILMAVSLFSVFFTVNAQDLSDARRDKTSNTAFITEKSAKWTDYENYLADLILSVNGTQVLEPLDVVIVLDRSGSMDMNYTQGGTHFASCPCLNPEHFYLRPKAGVTASVPAGTDEATILYENDGAKTVTVYNAEKEAWVVLDASEEVHLYYQFTAETLELGAYHFKGEIDGNLTRISEWDTADVRQKTNKGIWDHAHEAAGCYDRWTEAKNAIAEFTEALLAANPQNRVSLVPFSIHDDEVVKFLNSSDSGYDYDRHGERQWLIDQGYFSTTEAFGVKVVGSALEGVYDSKVSWTSTASDITSVLPKLFTTSNTDYVYALSEAYEMLADRGATDNKGVVVFLSDGVPYPTSSANISFANLPEYIEILTEAITSTETGITNAGPHETDFWSKGKGYNNTGRVRHSVNYDHMNIDGITGVYSVDGQGAQIVTLSYMIDKDATGKALETMASNPESYIEIPANADSSSAGHLAKKLLDSSIFPGGRDSVLRDVVSKYFYVDQSKPLPAGVSIETKDGVETIVWEIGDIYAYTQDEEPTITIPLILKEPYRTVDRTTYYPTNADAPEPSLYEPGNGPDGEETGAKLYYTDPDDDFRYDTIGTPKLDVYPPTGVTPATSVIPGVVKNVVGDVPNHSAAFTFKLTRVTSGAPMPEGIKEDAKSVVIHGSGSGSFGSIVFTEKGVYTYKISEVNSGYQNYGFDLSSYTLTITVTEANGKLTATYRMVKDGTSSSTQTATFVNTYIEPDGDLTLYLSKRLTDEDGEIVGTGKIFYVHIFDESFNLLSTVGLKANNGEIAVTGLQSGRVYYIMEETRDYYTVEGYSFFNTVISGQQAVGFRTTQLAEGATGSIRITVNNVTPDVSLIPDDDVPLNPPLPPDITVIEGVATPTTGNANSWIGIVVALVAITGIAILVVAVVMARKKKNEKL